MKSITIAIDSFKGSLSSARVAEAAEQGIRAVLPDCHVQKISIADGGEGTVEALVETLQGQIIEITACDPLMRPINVRYGLVDGGSTAVVEMSAASGLPLLAIDERNPWLTTTYGTGEMIADAIKRGARRLLIGIGGSATNDAGMGMLEALGYKFYDANGTPLAGCGGNLCSVARIDDKEALPALKECQITVACDVKNPLYGPTGAAYIFAPQKGADAEMVERLDQGLKNFASVVNAHFGSNAEQREGAGAAGGLGYCFSALLGARLQSGIDMVLEAIDFAKRIESSDLVITGEGRIDSQTVMGKAPSGVLNAATEQGIPVVAIGGAVESSEALKQSKFTAILPIVAGPVSLDEAMREEIAAANVSRTVEQIIKLLTLNR